MGFGNYLVMILSLGSPLLLAKSHLFPSFFYYSFPDEAAPTALGVNPFQIRNGIIQRYEQLASMIWLAGAVVLSQPLTTGWQAASLGALGGWLAAFLGSPYVDILGALGGWQAAFLGSPYVDILGAIVAGAVTWLVTMRLIKWLSARVYRPQMIEKYRKLFEQQAFILSHKGRTQEQVDRGEHVPAEARQRELMNAAQSLDRIGKLLDVPRGERETDEQFVERLKPPFSTQPVNRRWARWTRAIRWLTRRGL